VIKDKLHNARRILSLRAWVAFVALACLIAPLGVQAKATGSDPEAIRTVLLDVLEMQQVTVMVLGDTQAEETVANAIYMLKLATSEELLAFEGAVDTIAELHAQQQALNLQLADLKAYVPDMSNLVQQSSQFTPLLSLNANILGLTDAGYGTICSSNPFGDPPGGPNRANPDAVQAAGIANFTAETVREVAETVRDVASRACDQVLVAIGAGGNTSVACIAADVLYAVAKGVELAVRLAFYLLTFCDATIDGAEIEGAYERASDIYDQNTDLDADLIGHDANIDADLIAHDANIDADLVAHDANIDADLIAHDANIDADLAQHDADMKAALAQHDTDIKAALALLQGTVDENQRLIKIFMGRQLESMRLLITPSGQRTIDEEVLSCTGDNCPVYPAFEMCDDGSLSWNCN
jgi:hypothetical protein